MLFFTNAAHVGVLCVEDQYDLSGVSELIGAVCAALFEMLRRFRFALPQFRISDKIDCQH